MIASLTPHDHNGLKVNIVIMKGIQLKRGKNELKRNTIGKRGIQWDNYDQNGVISNIEVK